MRDFLSAYSIQHWLESCPQGYLEDTDFGHGRDEKEPELLLESPALLEQAISLTVQLVAGERCALAASSGLINSAPDRESKIFLATQTLDEARHVEIFERRLLDLGVKQREREDVIAQYANPNLVKFAETLLEKVDKGDFVAGVVGQNVVLEGMAFSVFEMLHAAAQQENLKFAHTLSGTIADERRHVGFGENRIGSLIEQHPEKKSEIEKMQEEMSYHMLAVFADNFRETNPDVERELEAVAAARGQTEEPVVEWQGKNLASMPDEEQEALLADTILGAFKQRLERIGLEYRTPRRP